MYNCSDVPHMCTKQLSETLGRSVVKIYWYPLLTVRKLLPPAPDEKVFRVFYT